MGARRGVCTARGSSCRHVSIAVTSPPHTAGGGGAVLAVGLAALLTLGVLWGATGSSAGSGTCVRSVDAAAAGAGAEAALVSALGDAVAGVGVDGCSDWTVELDGTFVLTDDLVWDIAVPLRIVGPAGTTARIEADAGAQHRLLTVDTFPAIIAVTMERLVLAGGNVAFAAAGDDEGGAVLADDLRLVDVELIANAAVAGGAVSTVDLHAVRTSFVRNEAEFGVGQGGAVVAVGDVVLDNVTFSGNVADEGGAVFLDLSVGGGSLAATFVTFLGNEATVVGSGADLHLDAAVGATPAVTLRGVLFGGPGAGSNADACGGTYDLGGAGSGLVWTDSFVTDASCGASLVSVLPAFDTVAWLAGTSPLPRPGADSPSVDAVACGAGWPTTDQRGLARPQGNRCDAGAVERVAIAPPAPDPAPDPAPSCASVAEGPVPTAIPAGDGACVDGCRALSSSGARADGRARQR